MKTPADAVWRILFPFVLLVAAAPAETARFLLTGPGFGDSATRQEAYVVTTSDAALIQTARDYLAAPSDGTYLVAVVNIATGADALNLNYAEPGRPAWGWHVTSLVGWSVFDPRLPRATVYLPQFDTRPSWVLNDLLNGATTYAGMNLVYFPLTMELKEPAAAPVVNVSTRGWVGAGERVLIAGFVVQGGEPRNVVIRALGPSLSAFGVSEPLADPVLTVFRGGAALAANDDWTSGSFAAPAQGGEMTLPWFAWLWPTNGREAALRLCLPPGAYTVHVAGKAGAAGVALVEVYDFDGLAPQ